MNPDKAAIQAIAAAIADGFTLGPLFHGTHERAIITFQRKSYRTVGIYLSADKRYADSYGTGSTIQAYARINNPYRIEMPDEWRLNGTIVQNNRIVAATYRELSEAHIATLEAAGYDGIVVNIKPGVLIGPWRDTLVNPFEVVVFNPENIRIVHHQGRTPLARQEQTTKVG